MIKIGIGGTMFKTAHGTLLSDKSSMLTKKNSSKTTTIHDQHGASLIDRNDRCPTYFEVIQIF